jgi:hypothetical protein
VREETSAAAVREPIPLRQALVDLFLGLLRGQQWSEYVELLADSNQLGFVPQIELWGIDRRD